MRKLYPKRIYPTVDDPQLHPRTRYDQRRVSRLKAEDLVDDRIVRKLEKEGAF